MGTALLYFAYDANIEPGRLRSVAPGAEFEFIAHLPEWILEYTIPNGGGGLPSVRPLPGNTVWGAVFSISQADQTAIDAAEAGEGRVPTTAQAMDREGRRHDVLTHVSGNGHHETLTPETSYVRLMVSGGRHWKLPAGWVMALEEHL
jgi:gamma-glutamylcyclotransferase